MTEITPPKRPFSMPPWLATILILIALAGGGWYVYYLLTGDKSTPDSMVVGQGLPYGPPRSSVDARPSMATRFGFGGGPAEGITARGAGAWTVRRGDVVLRAALAKGTYEIRFFDYLSTAKQKWVTPAQWQLHLLALQIVDDPSLAERLGVTADQKKQLQALNHAPNITDAERKTLANLLLKRDKAAAAVKETLGKELLTAVAAIGTAHQAEARAALATRVAEIPRVLTTQQIQLARDGAPSTRPAAPQ